MITSVMRYDPREREGSVSCFWNQDMVGGGGGGLGGGGKKDGARIGGRT